MRARWLVAIAAAALPLGAASAQPSADPHAGHAMGPAAAPLVHPFFTESALPMRMVRPDVSVTGFGLEQRFAATVEVQWTVVPRVALMVDAPYYYDHTSGFPDASGIGDVNAGLKVLLVRAPTVLVSAGTHLHLATGDYHLDFGTGHNAIAPFLLAAVPFGPGGRWALHTEGHVHASIKPLPPHTHAGYYFPGGRHVETQASTALSWTAPGGFTPLIEALVHGKTRMPATWAVAPGFRWGVAPGWDVGASVRIPSSYVREDLCVTVGLHRHFGGPS